jgi:ATP-binding cassette subfamily B multidrug efflux pump
VKLTTFVSRYVRPHLRWYTAGIAALVATNWIAVHIPLEVAAAIDALRTPDASGAVGERSLRIAAFGVAVIAVRTLSRIAFFTPGRNIEASIRHDLFASITRQQAPFLRRYPPGDLMSRASSDTNNVRLLFGFGILQLLNSVTAVAFAGVQMFRLAPALALAAAAPIALALLANQFFIRKLYVLIHRMQRELSALSDHILCSYQGVATVQAFGAEPTFLDRFDAANQAYQRTSLSRSNLRTVIGPLLAVAASLNVFVLLYFGGPLVAADRLTLGELVAFVTLIGMLVSPLRATSFLLSIWKQAQVGLERLGEVIDAVPERPDLPEAAAPPRAPPALRVQKLSFAYPDNPTVHVLHEVSFEVAPGSTLGIFGATGSGKTTLVRVLTRVFNPPPGTVFVDGTDIRRLDLDAWRRCVTCVPQKAFLFSETLAENILLGRTDDGCLDTVLAATTLDADVAALPQGTASPVGETGIMLSGGQRQRAAIARGLLRPHPVWILDDVLSAVDHETEHRLLHTLAQLSTGAGRPTTVLVSHRVSALQNADHILVLEHGRVVGQGSHTELIARPGAYRDTWERQREGESA